MNKPQQALQKKTTGKRRKSPGQQALSEQRVEAILKAATEVFLESGYASCSIDDVVARVNTSKATIYKHFKNKESLFKAVMDSIFVPRTEDELDFDEPDPEKALKEFALKRFKVVFSPNHFALLRLVLLESKRYPDMTKSYQELGPAYSAEILVDYFSQQKKRKTLSIKDPKQTAYVFMSLLMYRWFLWYLSQHWNGGSMATSKDIKKEVNIAVKTFMQLHKCL